jgi:hypothetical protein
MSNMVREAKDYVGLFLAFVVGLGIAFYIAGTFLTTLVAGTQAYIAVNGLITAGSTAVTTVGEAILVIALLVVLYKLIEPIISNKSGR